MGDENKKLKGLYDRTKRQAEAMGMAFGDFMRDIWQCKCEGDEPSMEEFEDGAGKYLITPFEGPPSYAKVVDVTGRDVTAIDGVDAALGLQRSGDESYNEIVTKVLARDHKRDEETPYCMEIFPEIE